MIDFYQKVNHHYTSKLPFVIYNKPNSSKIIGVFQKDNVLHFINDYTEKGFAFVAFDEDEKYYLPYEKCEIYVNTLIEDEFHFENKFSDFKDEIAKNNFKKLVESGVEAILNFEFNKVVLSRKEVFKVSNFSIETLFNKLNFYYKSAFNYIFFHPELGLWIAATPEQFLKVDNNTMQTVALAGTQLFYENIEWQEKEKQEQQFVVDFIADNLSKFSQTISVSSIKTVRAGNLAHLQSEIVAEINANDLGKIIKKLHPTPAVCGLPKENAKKFILNNEGYNREFYTGFVGELNCDFTNLHKKTDLFVNLRCMKIEDGVANLFLGCGITKDSNSEKEFVETVNKATTMKKVL